MARRFKNAVSDRNVQAEAHRGFSSTFLPEVVEHWRHVCAEWDADGFPKTAPNPFKVAETGELVPFNPTYSAEVDVAFFAGVSEAELEAQLSREEKASAKEARRAPLHSTSATSFLAMGLELEESQ